MADLVKLSRSAVRIGKPLLWPVFDAQGKLLLEKGYIVKSETQINQLIERGCYCPRQPLSAVDGDASKEAQKTKPSESYQSLLERLKGAHEGVTNKQEGAQHRILELDKAIHKLCQTHPDASLGLMHIKAPEAQEHERALLYAFLCNMLGCHMGLSSPRLGALMSAALTANLSIQSLFDRLNRSPQKLTPEQVQVVHKHPQLSAQLVYAAGVRNARWVHIIQQHHERFDGSGYPKGLVLDQILDEALILRLVEHYLALIGRRAYRSSSLPSTALLSLQQSDQSEKEADLVEVMMALLGPYPPGCFVKLANGEVAVVTRRGKDPNCPQVQAVVRANGEPMFGSLLRDTGEEKYQAMQLVEPVALSAVNLTTLWD